MFNSDFSYTIFTTLQNNLYSSIYPAIVLLCISIICCVVHSHFKSAKHYTTYLLCILITMFLITDFIVDIYILKIRSFQHILSTICVLNLISWLFYYTSNKKVFYYYGTITLFGPIFSYIFPLISYSTIEYGYYSYYIGHGLSLFAYLFSKGSKISTIEALWVISIFSLIVMLTAFRNTLGNTNFFYLSNSPIGNHLGWYVFSSKDYIYIYTAVVLISMVVMLHINNIFIVPMKRLIFNRSV